VEPASRRFWYRRGGARVDDSETSETGSHEVKAAPADEARAVRCEKRREALPIGMLQRWAYGRENDLQSSKSRGYRSKLAPCE